MNVLGVRVESWTPSSLIQAMVDRAMGKEGPLGASSTTVLYANVPVLNTAYDDEDLRSILNQATTVYCDGSGVRIGAALLGGSLPARLTSVDWVDALCARASSEGLSLFLMGGFEVVAARAKAVLCRRHVELDVVGTHHGYADDAGSERLVATINEARPSILVVGMGTPIQEKWIARHREALVVPVVWAVGALFDFLAGSQRRGPRWMTENHMEWLWRLGTAPSRLGGRYLLGNPLFIARVLRQRLVGTRRCAVGHGAQPG